MADSEDSFEAGEILKLEVPLIELTMCDIQYHRQRNHLHHPLHRLVFFYIIVNLEVPPLELCQFTICDSGNLQLGK